MTAKKQSLLDKGVILQDFPDAARLLASDNVNFLHLCKFACEAAQFATKSSSNFTFQFAVSKFFYRRVCFIRKIRHFYSFRQVFM